MQAPHIINLEITNSTFNKPNPEIGVGADPSLNPEKHEI